MTSRPLFISVALSIVILPPIAQVGCLSASSTVTSASSARVRPRNGPPEAVTVSRSTTPGRSPAISWCSAECSESTGISCAPVASHSAVTSSPPTTSDSLLASATSMPSLSATIVGPRPAEPTIALRTRSAPDSATSRASPSGPLRTSVVLGGARGRVGVGQREPLHAVLAGERQQRVRPAVGAQPDQLEGLRGPGHDVECLPSDRPRRPEDDEPLHRSQARRGV